jgi:hypothetical protein
MDDLPELISVWDQLLEQVMKLIKDIEANKWDAGVTVFVSNGTLDIRGLGVVDTPAAAAALLFAGIKSLPPTSQQSMLDELEKLMARSKVIAVEADAWRSQQESNQRT